MTQFRNKDLNVSQQTLSSGVTNPVTPSPLVASFGPNIPVSPSEFGNTVILPILPLNQEQDTAPIRRTEQEQYQLTQRVSGEDDLSPSTGPVEAIIPDRKPKITYYTNKGDLEPMELLICAIMQHVRECKVIPRIVFASFELAPNFRTDMEDFYGEETFNDTMPFLAYQTAIQRIPINFFNELSEDTIICVAGQL
jgi:hypothetical protein